MLKFCLPWPYAAKAIVQHEWDTDHLNVWVTFEQPMDQSIKPANNLWLCEADGVPKPVTASAWIDAFTILLTIDTILALPGRVTLEYNGPNENLRTTWHKYWEPWGPILSINVPYGWEDILIVDTVNHRVGVNIASPISTFHIYENTSTTDRHTGFIIEQDGSGDSILQFLITGVNRWVIGIDNSDADSFKIAATEHLHTITALRISTSLNAQFVGSLASGTLTHSAVGPTDNLNVSGVNTVFLDCSSNSVTIGGFVGGVNGQHLHVVRLCAAGNNATLEHNEATGNQNIFLHAGADETLTGEYGGWTLVCNGSNWYDVSHAKHV